MGAESSEVEQGGEASGDAIEDRPDLLQDCFVYMLMAYFG